MINFKIRSEIALIFIIILVWTSCTQINRDISEKKEELRNLDSVYLAKRRELRNLLASLEECEEVRKKSTTIQGSKSNFEFLGKWNTPAIYGGGSISIYMEDESFFKIEIFPDGSSFKNSMSKTIKGGRMIFKSLERVSTDSWVINQDGSLEVIDKDGIVYSVK